MKLLKILVILLTILIQSSQVFASKELITVKIGLLESFAALDSYATTLYEEFYRAAIDYGLGKIENKINNCGYKIETTTSYFDSSDLFSAYEAAKKLNTVWVIIGPVRSNHFIMASKALNNTPMISPMTEALSIANAKPPLFTMAPGMDILAKVAINASQKEKYGTTYATYVVPTCIECNDFVNSFDGMALKKKLKKSFGLNSKGELLDLKDLIKKLKKNKVDFLVLPNYSKFSGYVISQLHHLFPNLKYIGADGWGQTNWSFIPAYKIPSSVHAISIRMGMSNEYLAKKYKIYSLSQEWDNKVLIPPSLSYLIIELIRNLQSDLCLIHPKNKEEFNKFLSTQSKKHFRSKQSLGIYKLINGELKFAYIGSYD